MSTSSGLQPIRMPKWGLSMREGTLARWAVRTGDRIEEGMPLCDIETDKITNEYDAPVGGTVLRLLVEPYDVVPVGRLIAILGDGAASEAAVEAMIAAEVQAPVFSEDRSEPEVRHVEAGGIHIAYLEIGSGAATPVVFLHGFGGDHANWTMNQGVLAEGRRTIAFDLPGHGASDKSVGDGSAAALARPLAAALDALSLERIDLVAHSFGARVAAALVEARPEQVRSAVLIAPLAFDASANPAYVDGFVAAERKRDLKPVMELLFSDPRLLGREMVNDALHMLRDDAAREALRSVVAAIPGEAPGMAPSIPIQVIWGDRDRVVPMPGGLEARLGDRLHLVAGAGHMPHIERAADVNALTERFLRA